MRVSDTDGGRKESKTERLHVVHPGKLTHLEGGIKTSITHQRKMLEENGVTYTTTFTPDADLVHLNIFGPRDLYYFWRARRHNIPVIAHAHEIGENFKESFRLSTLLSPLVKRYLYYFYRRADRILTPSTYAKQALQENGVTTPINVVSNGINPERFDGVSRAQEKQEDGFTVINVSLLFERKGLTDFVSAATELPDITFTWFGKRFSRFLVGSRVERTVQNAPTNCDFPGFVEDIRDAFAAGDVFFFPTKSETQGLAVLEAAYCGLPLVVRDIPVYDDLLEHGTHCLKGNTVAEFVEHIQRLKADEELRQHLAENAQGLAAEHTLEQTRNALQNAYEKTVR